MKKLLALAAGIVFSLSLTAQDYMFVWQHDGTVTPFAVENIDSIGFYAPDMHVVTLEVGKVENTLAVVGGSVVGALPVTECGVCYGTGEYPTVEDGKLVCTLGTGLFTDTIHGLTAGTTYYVRAYATTVLGTTYGDPISFTTTNIVVPPVGAICGRFSIDDNKQVFFSKGNLQYSRMGPDTWRFAEHQWDIVGMGYHQVDSSSQVACVNGGTLLDCDNRLTAESDYFGWIDLFGFDSGTDPTKTSTLSTSYLGFTDWGVNPIQNGGGVTVGWRTLNFNEWRYLIAQRTDHDRKLGLGSVNGINGMILLPDVWTLPEGVTFTPSADKGLTYPKPNFFNSNEDNFTHNTYTAEEWALMEAAGAVFLPAAGYRSGSKVVRVGGSGLYWSSYQRDKFTDPYYMNFSEMSVTPVGSFSWTDGLSVRLVAE